AIFYDIGHVSAPIRSACADADILVIESNHDEHLLRTGPYAPWLQARIASNVGHLSNRAAARFAADQVSPALHHVVLAHLSANCNTPKVALRTASAELRRTRFRGRLTVASQDVVVGPFEPKAGRAERAAQFELGF